MKKMYIATEGSMLINTTTDNEILIKCNDDMLDAIEYTNNAFEYFNKVLIRNGIKQDISFYLCVEYFLYSDRINDLGNYDNDFKQAVFTPCVRVSLFPEVYAHDVEEVFSDNDINYFLDHSYVVDYNLFMQLLDGMGITIPEDYETLDSMIEDKKFTVRITKPSSLTIRRDNFKVLK